MRTRPTWMAATVMAGVLFSAGMAHAQAPAAGSENDPRTVWASLQTASFAGGKVLTPANVTLVRDRIRITLTSGTLWLAPPVAGMHFAAEFRGQGRVEIAPPNPLEAHQLLVFTGQPAMDMTFTEAVFSFSDDTAAEFLKHAPPLDVAPGAAGALYNKRQESREDVGAELVPRLFQSVLSADRKRTALFVADLKTKEKDWVHVRHDALEPEEVRVGRWVNFSPRFIGFDTWLSFPAADRSAAEAFHDPLAKEDVLIRSYKISASVTAGAELGAATTVNFTHRVSGERVVRFELDANLRATSVKDTQGAALPFIQPRDPKDRDQSYGDYIAIVLPEASRAGEARTFELVYSGKRVVRKVGPGNYFCQSSGWYPTRPNSFATRSDFDMTFRNPKAYALVATGSKTSETRDGDQIITTWKSDIPLAVAGFAFGEYKIETQMAGAVEIAIYANRQPDDSMSSILQAVDSAGPSAGVALGSLTAVGIAKQMGQEMANTIRVFESYFGPYPFKRLAVTNIPFSYGQGWPGLIYLSMLSFLDGTQRHQLGLRDQVGISDFFRAHESSHQWWGHRVSWKSYHDQWLSEGFAQFSGNLYVQFSKNNKEFIARLKLDKRDLSIGDLKNRRMDSLGPVWMGSRLSSADAPGGYNTVIYSKGGLILNALRMMLSNPRAQNQDERFIAMMKDFCKTYDNQAASTEDFKAMAEKHMAPVMDIEGNGKLDWFFRQYVYGMGLPKYEFRYSVQPAADGKFMLSGTVTQSNVPEGWMDILPLYLETGGRTLRAGWITVTKSTETFSIPLPMKPDKVMLNVNEDVLADIKQ